MRGRTKDQIERIWSVQIWRDKGLLTQPFCLGDQKEGACWWTQYHYIWVNLITTSLFSLTGIMVNKGNDPQMAARFRLVKYYNLPRLYHHNPTMQIFVFYGVMEWYEIIPLIISIIIIIYHNDSISYYPLVMTNSSRHRKWPSRKNVDLPS